MTRVLREVELIASEEVLGYGKFGARTKVSVATA
jgi:hypothetical protein